MKSDFKSLSQRLIMRQFRLQLGLALIALSVLVTFQNCSPPPAQQDVASLGESLPFAYDIKIDHLAYMSCTGLANSAAYFSFKAGAYNNGNGLKLSDEFLGATVKMTPAMRAEMLEASLMNNGVIPQISIRSKGNYQLVDAFGNFPGPLSVDPYASILAHLSTGARTNNFNGQKVQGQLVTVPNESSANQLRNDLSHDTDGKFVGITFYQPGGTPAYAAAPDANSKSSVYGFGYRPTFRQSSTRALASVNEVNLRTNSPTNAIWDCSEQMTFKIVHGGDIGGVVNCGLSDDPRTRCCVSAGSTDYPATMNAQQQQVYASIRKILPSDWSIDVENRCIVVKSGVPSCYGTAEMKQSNVNYTCTNGNNCPHFVSVCKRL